MGAAGMRARAREDDRVEALLGELTRTAEATEDFEDDAAGVDFQGSRGGSDTSGVEAVIARRDILADERITEQFKRNAGSEGTEDHAGGAVDKVVTAQPAFDAAAVEFHDYVVRRDDAVGDELVGVDLQSARTEDDCLALTGAVRAPALHGVGIVGESGIGHRPAGLVDV